MRAVRHLLLAACCVAAGCGEPPAEGMQPVGWENLAVVAGLDSATHVLSGPAFVPPELAGQAVAMDRIQLANSDKQAIRRSLARLRWRTPWVKTQLPDCPVGYFCRYYAGGKPCGPWLMAFPMRARRHAAWWEVTAFRVRYGQLESSSFGVSGAPPDLTGACKSVSAVFPTPEAWFPWRRPSTAPGAGQGREGD